MIRWKGLAKLLVVLSVFFGGYLLFFDKILTATITAALETAADAKVEIKETKLSLSPFGITIQGLKVGDVDAPMKNLFETDTIEVAIDLTYLMEGKYVVEIMKVSGLEFGTKREVSGSRVEKKEEEKEASSKTQKGKSEESPESPSVRRPVKQAKATDLLDKVALETRKKKDEIDALIEQKKEELKTLTHTDDYTKRLEKAKTDLAGSMQLSVTSVEDLKQVEASVKTIQAIKKDMSDMKHEIVDKQKKVREDITLIKAEIKSLKKRGDADYKKAMSTLNLDTLKSGDVSQAFLKGPLQEKLLKVRDIWRRVQRAFPSSSKSEDESIETGITVSFPRPEAPVPRLLIQTIYLSGGNFKGEIRSISSDQAITGPTQFLFDFSDKRTRGEVSVLGETVSGRLVSVVEKDSLPGVEDGSLLARVLKDIENFEVLTTIKGTLLHPKISMSSELDSKLKSASKALANEALVKAKRALKSKVDKQVDDARKDTLEQLSRLDNDYAKGLAKDLKDVESLDALADKGRAQAKALIEEHNTKFKRAVAKAKVQLNKEKNKAVEEAKKALEDTFKSLW